MISNFFTFMRRYFDKLFSAMRRRPLIAGVLVCVLLGAIYAGVSTLLGGANEGDEGSQLRTVSLQSVESLSTGTTSVSAFGNVRSVSEASVRAESSGEVTVVYYSLGDRVTAGAPVAEIRNASERASVAQADAALSAARANLEKVTGGARPEQRAILESQLVSAEASFAAAKGAAENAVLSAYAAIDDAVRAKADAMFSNPTTPNPSFIPLVSDTQLAINVENLRPTIQTIIARQQGEDAASFPFDAPTLSAELATVEEELRLVRAFLDALLVALGRAVPSQQVSSAEITAYQSSVSGARTAVTASLGGTISARESLAARLSGLEVARSTLEQGVVGGQTEDVASTEAAVRQAEASLAVARASLERTILRAPISGTLNTLSVLRGNFISAGSPAFTVANNAALEVVAYVSDGDMRSITPGASVVISGDARGVVTRLAPAADPVTRRVEVQIGVTEQGTVVNGQSVSITIQKSDMAEDSASLIIPITAVKIEPGRTVVFSVDEESRLVARPVELGALLGERVEIAGGISKDTDIVLDARGLREGQSVIVRR